MAPLTRSVTKKKKKDTKRKNTGGARARSSAKGRKRPAPESDDEGDEEEQEEEKSSSDDEEEEPVPTPKAKGKGKAKKQKTTYGDDGGKERNKRHGHSPKTVAMSDRTFTPRQPISTFPMIQRLSCWLYHPGYDKPQLLYRFNRLDKIQDDEPSNSPPRASTSNRPPPPKNDENYGIQFGFVLAAAHIIACNDRNGYLSLNPLPNPEDDLSFYYSWESTISAKKIYYHIPSLSSKSTCWPVCSDFREWPFPHDNIPAAWGNMEPRWDYGSKSAFSAKVKETAASRCAVTGTTRPCGIDSAHVVPKEENTWFTKNQMNTYNGAANNGIQDVANGFPLRKDVHASCFDARHFVPFPLYIPDKPNQESEFSVYFTYFHNDLYAFHKALFLYPPALHPAFLFARFAWTILADTFRVTTDKTNTAIGVDEDSSQSSEVDKKSSEAEDDEAVDEDLASGANNSGRGRGQGGKGKSSGRGGKGGASGGTRERKVSHKTGQVDGAESTDGAVVLSEEIDTGGGDLDRATLRKMHPWADEEKIEELYEEEQARIMKEDWIKKNPQVRELGDASTQVDNTDYTRIESLVNNPYQLGFYSLSP